MQGGGEDPGEGAKTKKMKFMPIVKKKKDKKSGETQKKSKGSSSNPGSTAAFHELMEAAQSEADWERGSGRRYKDHTMGAVAFGASGQASGLPGQGIRNAWGGAPTSSAARSGGTSSHRGGDGGIRNIPNVKLESVKEEKFKGEVVSKEKKAEEEMLDFATYYPTFLPFSNEETTTDGPNTSLVKDIVADSTEGCSAADELNLCGGNPGMMLFQLPGVLPVAAAQNQADEKRTPGNAKAHTSQPKGLKQAMNSRDLPGGRIGKLLIFKSGKVKMKIGEVLLDVSPGIPYPCRQDVVGIHMGSDANESHCVFMGPVGTKPVCTLDIFQLLSLESLPDFHTFVGKKEENVQATKYEEPYVSPGPLMANEETREDTVDTPAIERQKDPETRHVSNANDRCEDEQLLMPDENQFDFMEEDGQHGEPSDMDEDS